MNCSVKSFEPTLTGAPAWASAQRGRAISAVPAIGVTATPLTNVRRVSIAPPLDHCRSAVRSDGPIRCNADRAAVLRRSGDAGQRPSVVPGVSRRSRPPNTASVVNVKSGDRDCADQQQSLVQQRQPAGDELAQTAGADECGQRGAGDDFDRRRPDAGHDDRQGQRELDLPEHLKRIHPETASVLQDRRGDRPQPGVGVDHQRRSGQQGQRRQRRLLAEPPERQ